MEINMAIVPTSLSKIIIYPLEKEILRLAGFFHLRRNTPTIEAIRGRSERLLDEVNRLEQNRDSIFSKIVCKFSDINKKRAIAHDLITIANDMEGRSLNSLITNIVTSPFVTLGFPINNQILNTSPLNPNHYQSHIYIPISRIQRFFPNFR